MLSSCSGDESIDVCSNMDRFNGPRRPMCHRPRLFFCPAAEAGIGCILYLMNIRSLLRNYVLDITISSFSTVLNGLCINLFLPP